MKKINKRTLAWGILTVCVLAAAAFSDDIAFVKKVASDKTVTAESKNNELELLLEENQVLTAGVADVSFLKEEESVLLSQTTESKAGAATLEAMNAPIVTLAQEEVTPWSNKAMANVDIQANVRAEASEESEMVGKLRRGDVADVVEKGEEWTLITSGNVKGYVKTELLVIGAEAETFANETCNTITTVQTDGLNVRKQPAEEADIWEQVEAGKQFISLGEENGWAAVKLASGETGYVNAQYVTNELELGKAITMEEEQAAIQAEEEAKKAAEEAARKAAEAKAAKEKAAKEAKAKKQAKVTKTQTASTTATVDDLTLLAAVIEMEAGTHYEGGVAVGNVVLNRVSSGKFPNSISGVVYQRGQFPGAHNGKLAKILARGPKQACINAAQAALNGENYAGGRLYFNSQGSVNYNRISNYVIIGGNCFY